MLGVPFAMEAAHSYLHVFCKASRAYLNSNTTRTMSFGLPTGSGGTLACSIADSKLRRGRGCLVNRRSAPRVQLSAAVTWRQAAEAAPANPG